MRLYFNSPLVPRASLWLVAVPRDSCVCLTNLTRINSLSACRSVWRLSSTVSRLSSTAFNIFVKLFRDCSRIESAAADLTFEKCNSHRQGQHIVSQSSPADAPTSNHFSLRASSMFCLTKTILASTGLNCSQLDIYHGLVFLSCTSLGRFVGFISL